MYITFPLHKILSHTLPELPDSDQGMIHYYLWGKQEAALAHCNVFMWSRYLGTHNRCLLETERDS